MSDTSKTNRSPGYLLVDSDPKKAVTPDAYTSDLVFVDLKTVTVDWSERHDNS